MEFERRYPDRIYDEKKLREYGTFMPSHLESACKNAG